MKLADLSAADQAAVRAALNGMTARTRPRPSRAECGGPTAYVCKGCGERSASWPAAERHSRATRHGRQEAQIGVG